MAVEFNHTIVSARDQAASATFLAEMLGVAAPTTYGPFHVVQLDNGVSIDFLYDDGPIPPRHYAFLVGEAEFDAVLARLHERQLPYWADSGRSRRGEINTNDGGRGLYWQDPDGHFLEVITRPYGSGS